jgi:glycosyltransferase involved in cell wall biosynthesis
VSEQIEDGVNGFVVPPANPIALADALEKLLLNPELRQQMGTAGRDRVQRYFSTDAYVNGVLEVYQSLLTKRVSREVVSKQALPV